METQVPVRGAVRPYKCSHCQDGQIIPMPTIVVDQTPGHHLTTDTATDQTCLEMVTMGASLEAPPPQKRKKSKVKMFLCTTLKKQ